MIGRIPGIDNGRMHQPNVSLGFLPKEYLQLIIMELMVIFMEVIVVVEVIMEMATLIVNQRFSHLSVFRSCMAAQCPVEIMFMK